MSKIFIIISLAFISFGRARAASFDHSIFDALLQKHVVDGRVDYKALRSDPGDLQRYLDQLDDVRREDFSRWSREEQMAFWINAYNAITIYGIVQNYPIQYGGMLARARFPQNSIRQIKNLTTIGR